MESFNISVAGALVMYEAQQQRLRKLGLHGDLTQAQRAALKAQFMLRSVVGVGGMGPAHKVWRLNRHPRTPQPLQHTHIHAEGAVHAAISGGRSFKQSLLERIMLVSWPSLLTL